MAARRWIVAAIVVAGAFATTAWAGGLADGLATDDPVALDAAVHAIEVAPAGTDAADLAPALFAAARACEDRLHQPARALALDERILRELPDAGVATAAARRADALRAELGGDGANADRAAALSALIATADALPADDVEARGDALAAAGWPGAPDAALWLAEWTRRTGRFAAAQARYAAVASRWAGTPTAIAAIRGGAGCAIDAHAWPLAEVLAAQLPTADPADRVVHDELLAAIAAGRWRARIYVASWLAIALAFAVLAGSLVRSLRAARRRWPPRRPPTEIALLAPAAAVLVGVSLTAHPLIAPAVTTISIGGLALAWLSGLGLDVARAAGRPTRARTALHLAVCFVGVLALVYIALMRDGLLDTMLETVRFGPEG